MTGSEFAVFLAGAFFVGIAGGMVLGALTAMISSFGGWFN